METYWSRFVEDYDKRREYVGGIELDALMKRRFEEQLSLGEILEFGCGTGYFTRCVVGQSKSILATDYSSQMVSAMERTFADESTSALSVEFPKIAPLLLLRHCQKQCAQKALR